MPVVTDLEPLAVVFEDEGERFDSVADNRHGVLRRFLRSVIFRQTKPFV